MIIQARCFNCDREAPKEVYSLEAVVILICIRCRPTFEECVDDCIKNGNMSQKEALLDVLSSIVEDGPL